MAMPYMYCPFMNQYPETMYMPQMSDPPEQNVQQIMPASQYNPMQFIPGPMNYPMPTPYGTTEDTDIEDVGPSKKNPKDPPPILSNNPVAATIVLFKELTAYPNYGNPSRNADILYTGNRGSWTFETPAFLFVPGNLRAQIRIRAVLDDHANVPVSRYSARITINGNVVHNGRVPLEHGIPAGGIFTNWRELPFTVTTLRRVTRVTIENTSTAGTNDWIAFDWMELRFVPR